MRKHSIWWPNPFQALTLYPWISKIHTTGLIFSPKLQPTSLSSYRYLHLDILQASQTQRVPNRGHDPALSPQAGLFPQGSLTQKTALSHIQAKTLRVCLCFSSSSVTTKQSQTLFGPFTSHASICPPLSIPTIPTKVHITLFYNATFPT